MFLRIDGCKQNFHFREKPDPNAAAALQELLGGKYVNVTSITTCSRASISAASPKLRPFYSLGRQHHSRRARSRRTGKQRRCVAQ